MFYSHQLLARKAPLGQIWMAATLDSKIKRRNLEKLDIPRICEEILNPSIPMALRLSGILMGGVVNVYKRKVDFLYDDANRFLEDFNKTFRAKSNANDYSSKTQAKRKAQARSEAAITIDDKNNAEFDDNIYASSDSLYHAVRFQRMTLEDMDDHYINIDIGNEDLSAHHHHHQADPADITLPDKLEFSTLHGAFYDHFERFDIGDGIFSAEADFTSQAMLDTQPEVFEEQSRAHPHEDLVVNEQMEIDNQIPEEAKHEVQMSFKEEQEVRGPSKKKTRRNVNKVIIDKQMVIPSETYHSWLKETTNICRIKKRSAKPGSDKLRSTKLDILLGLPPLCLMPNSFNEIQYPEQLLELWRKHAIGNPQTPPPTHRNINAFYPFPEESLFPDSAEVPRPVPFDIEKMREAVPGKTASSGSHDLSSRSIHSSETGFNPVTFGRPSSKTQSSLSIGNLDTVVEDLDAMMPIFELLEETGPTQTPLKEFKSSADQVTESIRSQLKSHFDISGNSTAESLNQLTDEFTRKKAAQLFYHTCVMATMDYVKVEQFVPYGDIFISRGTKM